jgi:hypothetical protein
MVAPHPPLNSIIDAEMPLWHAPNARSGTPPTQEMPLWLPPTACQGASPEPEAPLWQPPTTPLGNALPKD